MSRAPLHPGHSRRGAIPLAEKVITLQELGSSAIDLLVGRLAQRRCELLDLALERHVAGHFEHGDGYLYEYDAERLLQELDEEIADAIVYAVRRLSLAR